MIQENINIINQAVDTYKEHYYPNMQLTQGEKIDYNDFVADLLSLKKDAQKIANSHGDERFITEDINGHKFHVMSSSQKGFAVTVKNGDVSISFKRFKIINKQPCIKVEYRAEYLARYGYVKCVTQMNRFLKEIIPHTYSVASEIHLCTDIQNYDFTILDFFRMKTRSRKKEIYMEADGVSYFDGRKYTGFTIGSGDLMVRIYNKTREIQKYPEKGFVKPSRWLVSPDFNEDKDVWRVEVQIRRSRLKHLMSEKGFMDNSSTCLNSIPDIWALFMEKFTHKGLDDDSTVDIMRGYKVLKNGSKKIMSNYAINKRFQRADNSYVWDSIKNFFHTEGRNLTKIEEITKPSVLYVQNSLKGVISTMTKLQRGGFCPFTLADIALKTNDENKETKGMSLFDSARIKSISYLNEAKTYYENMSSHGLVVEDELKQFENDLHENILNTFRFIYEDDIPTIETIEQINKALGYQKIEVTNVA